MVITVVINDKPLRLLRSMTQSEVNHYITTMSTLLDREEGAVGDNVVTILVSEDDRR